MIKKIADTIRDKWREQGLTQKQLATLASQKAAVSERGLAQSISAVTIRYRTSIPHGRI